MNKGVHTATMSVLEHCSFNKTAHQIIILIFVLIQPFGCTGIAAETHPGDVIYDHYSKFNPKVSSGSW